METKKFTVPQTDEVLKRRAQVTAMAIYSIAKNIVKYRNYNCTVEEFMANPEKYEGKR